MMEMNYDGIVVTIEVVSKNIANTNLFLDNVPSEAIVFLCLYGDGKTDIKDGPYKKSLNAIVNNHKAVCYYGDVDLNIFNVMTGKFNNSVFAFRKDTLDGYEIKHIDSFLKYLCEKDLVHIHEYVGNDIVPNLAYIHKSSLMGDYVLKHIANDFEIAIPTKNIALLSKAISGIKEFKDRVMLLCSSKNPICNSDLALWIYCYEFNYSKIHNDFLMDERRNKYCILMNDDIECTEETIKQLLAPFMYDSRLAVVGARLYFPDGTLQHAGVKIDRRLGAIHPGRGHLDTKASENFDTENCVTFALVAIDVAKYRELGGMDENLPYDFNDIDYCLRCKEVGYKVLYNPMAKAIHHESVTRKIDDKCGVSEDIKYFRNKHGRLFR